MKKSKIISALLIIAIVLVLSCSKQQLVENSNNNSPTTSKQEMFVDYNIELNKISPQEAWEIFKKEYGLHGEMKAGGAAVKWNEERKIPQYVVGFRSKQYLGSPQEIATSFLQEHGNLIKLQNNSLYSIDIYESGEENRVIYEQRYQNIPVFGTQVQALVTSDGRVRQLVVDYYPDIKIFQSNKPKADNSKFKEVIRYFLVNKSFKEGQELTDFIESRKPEKFIYPVKKDSNIIFYSTLLYRLPETRLFLDANTAEIIQVEDSSHIMMTE